MNSIHKSIHVNAPINFIHHRLANRPPKFDVVKQVKSWMVENYWAYSITSSAVFINDDLPYLNDLKYFAHANQFDLHVYQGEPDFGLFLNELSRSPTEARAIIVCGSDGETTPSRLKYFSKSLEVLAMQTLPKAPDVEYFQFLAQDKPGRFINIQSSSLKQSEIVASAGWGVAQIILGGEPAPKFFKAKFGSQAFSSPENQLPICSQIVLEFFENRPAHKDEKLKVYIGTMYPPIAQYLLHSLSSSKYAPLITDWDFSQCYFGKHSLVHFSKFLNDKNHNRVFIELDSFPNVFISEIYPQ